MPDDMSDDEIDEWCRVMEEAAYAASQVADNRFLVEIWEHSHYATGKPAGIAFGYFYGMVPSVALEHLYTHMDSLGRAFYDYDELELDCWNLCECDWNVENGKLYVTMMLVGKGEAHE